jgi:GNAT superfamily N-acetyltransferase
LLDNIFIESKYRGKGFGTILIKYMIDEAKRLGCYKLIATSRDSNKNIHSFYNKLVFTKHGAGFRINILDVIHPPLSDK